jgi:DNA polymerase I-like protein with 3'-5' exonuclease and polymerase domains
MATPLEDRDQGWKSLDPARYQVAFTYKSLNRLIQASSADQTKMAMMVCVEKGYLPMLTVHDELCFSIENDEQVAEIKYLMENCVPDMAIPSVIDTGIGTDWGNAK